MNERFDRDSAQKALAAADNLRQLLAAFKQQMRDITITQQRIISELNKLFPQRTYVPLFVPEEGDRKAYVIVDRTTDSIVLGEDGTALTFDNVADAYAAAEALEQAAIAETEMPFESDDFEKEGEMEFRAAEIPEPLDDEDVYAMRDSKFVEEANEVPDKEETSKAEPDVPGQLGGQDSAPEPAAQETVPEAGEVEEDYSKTLVAPFALK